MVEKLRAYVFLMVFIAGLIALLIDLVRRMSFIAYLLLMGGTAFIALYYGLTSEVSTSKKRGSDDEVS